MTRELICCLLAPICSEYSKDAKHALLWAYMGNIYNDASEDLHVLSEFSKPKTLEY